MYKKSMNFRNKYLLISLSRVLVSDCTIDQNEMQPNEFFITIRWMRSDRLGSNKNQCGIQLIMHANYSCPF